MSAALDKLIADLGKDAALRKKLAESPDEVFGKYPDLTEDERTALKSTVSDIAPKSRLPQSYKEVGALALSVLTVLFFAWAVLVLVTAMNAPPVFTAIPGTDPPQTVSFQPFERAQILFNAVLPLFGALFAYWLGVQVEGRRADEANKRADEASGDAASERKDKEALLGAATPEVLNEAKARYPALFNHP